MVQHSLTKAKKLAYSKPAFMAIPSDADASGRDLGKEELDLLKEVIESGTLWSVRGKFVRKFEEGFAKLYGAPHCIATTSGTASIHAAVAAINPEPGDEIITTPITDMGGIAPILYQGAIPIFADVDPKTFNITANSIRERLTSRTKAIIVVHLFGNPCDMDPIMDLARKKNIYVIEDCAQAYFAQYKGKNVGTIGDIGCFSLQQGKHMTTGEGGLVITKNEMLARRMRLFVNKAWGYGDPNPDHYFLALNYRMTELQGAVGLAQLKKVKRNIEKRQKTAQDFSKLIKNFPGIVLPQTTPNSKHVYWKYSLLIEPEKAGIDTQEASKRLKEGYGIHSQPRYIQKPAFLCQVLKEQQTLGSSRFPFSLSQEVPSYDPKDFPQVMQTLNKILVLPWNEFYSKAHIQYIASSLKAVLDAKT